MVSFFLLPILHHSYPHHTKAILRLKLDYMASSYHYSSCCGCHSLVFFSLYRLLFNSPNNPTGLGLRYQEV